MEIDPEDSEVLYNAACAFSLAGETEKAIDCLEKLSWGKGQKGWLENDSDFDPLRDHPRFQAFMEQLK